MKRFFRLLIGCWFATGSLPAEQWTKTYANTAFVGPEIYYMKRDREGGSKQGGVLYGVRAGCEHLKRNHLYWGVDGLWAQGTLNGHVCEEPLKSTWTDANLEARIGYNFQSKCWRCLSFVPYLGIGNFWEKNHYQHPTVIPLHFKNTFLYVPLGFLSQAFLTPNWSIGLNFKVRLIVEGFQRVSHDPHFEKATLHYNAEPQYRVELPLLYFFCWRTLSLAASLEPFFESRFYGHRANYPFDFFDTHLKLYGATVKLFALF